MEYRYFGMFRLFLALLVASQHFAAWLGPPKALALATALLPGTLAVLVFYSLSGFIMMESICELYLLRPAAFIANRAVRILVPFAICLTLSIATHWFAFPPDQAARGVSRAEAFSARNIAANYFDLLPVVGPREAYSFLPIFWAVRYEVAFYLLCFAGILLAGGRPGRFRVLVLGLVLASVGADLAAHLLPGHGPQPAFISALCLYFALGMSLYFAQRGDAAQRGALVVVAAGCVHGLAAVAPGTSLGRTALLVGLLLAAWRLSLVSWPSLARLDVRCGDLSYPVYLLHFPSLLLVRALVPPSGGLGFGLALVLSLALSIAFVLVVEPPIAALRTRIRGRRLGAG